MNALLRSLLVLLILVCIAIVLAGRLNLDHRLDAFLPPPASDEQTLVTDQLGAGPGSRMLFAAISGGPEEQLVQATRELAGQWQTLPGVERVDTGEWSPDETTLDRLMALRFVLVDDIDARLEADRLADSLRTRLSEMAFAGRRAEQLVRRDPLGLVPEIAGQLGDRRQVDSYDDIWFDPQQERTMMVVVATAPPFDIEAQSQLIGQLHASFDAVEAASGLDLTLAGTPVISVDAAARAQRNATWLSAIGSAFLMLVLLAAWRSPTLVIAGAIPLAAAAVCALAVLTLLFDQVHALTLAFGFTLLGVALDYPVHLFGHSGSHRLADAARTIRRPLVLGALSTVIAYLAIFASPSPGLSQLGAASAAGLAAAALTALMVLPRLSLPNPPPTRPLPRWLPYWPWLPLIATILGLGALTMQGESRWSHDLSRLSPTDPALIAQEADLRQRVGGDELRYLMAISGEDLEQVLQATEETVGALEHARQSQWIDDWRAVTELVPSRATQASRRAGWPDDDELRQRLMDASEQFRGNAFDPFLDDLTALDDQLPVTPDSWAGTRLEHAVDSLLEQHDGRWRSLIIPVGLDHPGELADWLIEHDSPARLVDLMHTAESMVAEYRREVLVSLAIAVALIIAVLLIRLRALGPAARAVTPPLAAVICTAAVMAQFDGGLTIVHLIGLLLAGGIGLDFALFSLALTDSAQRRDRTNRSIGLCALSTGGVFLILGQSSIGLLNMLGQTVATGILLSLIFTWMTQPKCPPTPTSPR